MLIKLRVLFIAWQDPKGRTWYPVGKLTHTGKEYTFVYTKGSNEAPNFRPFGRMTDLHVIYKSDELFPLFANRLLSKNRPENKSLKNWLNLKNDIDDPLALLSLTGGIRETDSLMVFPCPIKNEYGQYHVHFFSHGIRYLPKEILKFINNLKPGDRLFLMPDPQNIEDSYAIALRTSSPVILVGYCPRYLNKDIHEILKISDLNTLKLNVERVNIDAPIQLRLLCNLSVKWPDHYHPCSNEMYEPIVK